MKLIKSALAGLALSAISLAAHAGFTASLSGPSALRPWYSGTFELTLQYTPLRPASIVSGVGEMYTYSYDASYLNLYYSLYKDGVEYANDVGFPGPITSPSSFIQWAQPTVLKTSFVWTAGDVGDYEIVISLVAQENIYRGRSVWCSADPICSSFGPNYFDVDTIFENASANLAVDVTPTAPIPEPQTYALMLAGLGLVSAFVGRHKKQG